MLSSAQVDATQIKSLNPPRIPAVLPVRTDLPRRDAPIRIAALRVEFQRDTLSTTTGDGSFAYSRLDSLYASFDDTTNIFFDPAPHDSLYFADQLQFQQFYWDKMSNGAVTMEWDIFPAGAQVAYQLPKQMWQYNHNNGDAQLDHGLSELFRDAVIAADVDPMIVWQSYDLVIIFHAGAGAEFDLGYTTTPHDIPSAWMVPEDFRTQLNLPDGIPVDGGVRHISSGIILPETESHEGVQISVAGVITLMIGHWMGLPALYDRDDGKAVVGKWSMMDRGFGNFYGALPGPVDAWSANKMGWMNLQEAVADTNRITARFQLAHPSDPDPVRGLRISISDQEEFILECRQRDPEADSVTYAYDRDGKRMTFKDDYTVEIEHGFKVPVSAEDFDFDSPGTGILIWHHDKGLDNLIPEGRFNSVNELRGLDFEEADGAQDIGQDYPLLTAGYGTDYGIYEDAWYGDNTAHKNANGGRFVSFNDDSYPASRSNSGAFTHIKLDNFSRRAGVMGFRYGNSFWNRIIPVHLDQYATKLVQGNFDGDSNTLEFGIVTPDSILLYGLDGHVIQRIISGSDWTPHQPAVRDFNGDGMDEVVWCSTTRGDIYILGSSHHGYQLHIINDINGGHGNFNYAFGGVDDSIVLALLNDGNTPAAMRIGSEFAVESILNLPPGTPIGLHRLGSVQSDTFVIVQNKGAISLWLSNGSQTIASIPVPNDASLDYSALADFDGDGAQDLMALIESGSGTTTIVMVPGPLDSQLPLSVVNVPTGLKGRFVTPVPVDVNTDGLFDIFGENGKNLIALNHNGTVVDGFPIQGVAEGIQPWPTYTIGDFTGDGRLDYGLHNWRKSLNILSTEEDFLLGFPVPAGYARPMFMVTGDSIAILVPLPDNIGIHYIKSNGSAPSIWWQGPYRDNDHSNAVWEPATPFSPAPSAPLMPSELCYNWPNPASESTAIRFTLNFAATVKVTIFDIAGDKVATLHGQGQAGVPNEIIWNLKDVARGGYLAVVEAQGAGRSEKKTVKIAVKK